MALLDSILFVDDDPLANFQHKELISRLEIAREIFVRTNGEDALEFIKERYWLRQSLPSIILLDLNLPLLNGREFIQELRTSDLLGIKNIPIAVLTSYCSPFDMNLIQESGYCYDFKPLTESKLYQILQKALPLEFSQKH